MKRVGAEWLGPQHPAVLCLDLGVAVHHAGLPKAFLRELEGLLRAREVPVVIVSPTLAQGLNLSASTLLIYHLRRGGNLIEGEEFGNVIGRASERPSLPPCDSEKLVINFSRRRHFEIMRVEQVPGGTKTGTMGRQRAMLYSICGNFGDASNVESATCR